MKRKLVTPIAIAITIFTAGVQAKTTDQAVVLEPEPHMAEASKWATTFLTRAHYKKTELDDALSGQILDRYIESLDPNRIFFLESDVRSFEAYRSSLDDALLKQNIKPAFAIFNVYAHRVSERVAYARDLVKRGFNFNIDESLVLDRSEAPWAASEKELNEIWRKRVKNDVLRLRLAEQENEDIGTTLDGRYENLQTRVAQLDAEDVFQYFMNAFAASIEPHTGYLAPRTSENFNISMRLSLEGIGAVLQRDNEYTVVRRVVPGGPAHQDGRLKVGDRIVYVGQEREEATDVVGWRLDDVVDLIRGAAGTQVRLGVLPAETGLSGEVETIDIIRDQVKLEEQAAQKAIFEVENDSGNITRVGIIDLPAFYLDFAARARRDEDYRSSTRDVRELLRQLKDAQVDAVVVDLRNNGGGSLAEAASLTGLFIDQGPVVQVRDSNGRVDVEADTEEGVEWEGPLAVLVNRHSASASEIFAAAIQDYGRGVVVGEPTFGKGTVQNLINLDRYGQGDEPRFGQLRLTIAQFFRVNGGSTQHRGVIPDVMFPTMAGDEQYGESSFDNALPWTSIRPARYKIAGDLSSLLPAVSARSESRLKDNPEFQYLLQDLETYRDAESRTEISLLESVRRAEMEKREQEQATRKAAREAWGERSHGPEVRVVEALPATGEEESEEEEAGRPDVLMNETLRIMGDLVWFSSEARTAQLNTNKAQKELN